MLLQEALSSSTIYKQIYRKKQYITIHRKSMQVKCEACRECASASNGVALGAAGAAGAWRCSTTVTLIPNMAGGFDWLGKAYGLQLTYGMKCCILWIDHAFQLRLVIYWVIAFAFVASGSGYCILEMNNFMQLLILLLVFGRGACTVRGVRNIFNADATGGGDQRRRKSWQEWKYTGPPNFQPEEWKLLLREAFSSSMTIT